jgi:hypothetical protein
MFISLSEREKSTLQVRILIYLTHYSRHPCTLPCHLNDCPPCKTPVKKPCHCKSIRITVECHKTHDQELMKTLLCCGQICQKTLPACTHTCLSVCHFYACAAECKRKVNVRCTCNRIKQVKVVCLSIQLIEVDL